MKWKIEQTKLNLKYTWKISRNQSDFKINSIITVTENGIAGQGEAAPNIRYNETPESMLEGFEKFKAACPAHFNDLHDFTILLNSLHLPNALRFGIESAFIHFLCRKDETDVCTFLGIQKPMPAKSAFSIPIMPVEKMKSFYEEYDLKRFSLLKIKVNRENADEFLNETLKISTQPLIVDANESWKDPDELLRVISLWPVERIAILEQPFPAGMEEEYMYLKSKSAFHIFADESICDEGDFEKLKQQFHGINMKLMKAGGYLNGIRLLNEAVKHGMKTMIGCMVETTLGISSALNLTAGIDFVDLDGFLIIRDEPFHLVREENGVLSLKDLMEEM